MTQFGLMRFLESSPWRYDKRMRLITMGRITKIYDYVVSFLEGKSRVLDLCSGYRSSSRKTKGRVGHHMGARLCRGHPSFY